MQQSNVDNELNEGSEYDHNRSDNNEHNNNENVTMNDIEMELDIQDILN